MEVPIHNVDGTADDTVDLPSIFETPYRPDVIARAVRTAQANSAQPYGADEFAGKRTPAESPGSGRGIAHVPRQDGRARRVPQTVSGRRAHPPKPEADRSKQLNRKERRLAVRSAIAATADADRVADRGHRFESDLDLPIVVSSEFEDLEKTKDVVSLLEELGVYSDIERAEDGRSIRSGKGKMRGRKYSDPKSILVVTSSEAGPSRAARNLAGVDVVTADEVNVEDLAPGTHPGRLTIWSEDAIAEVASR